ncbi:hypothetical protein [Brachybacterium sp. GPGPB12]|uniref:hypothetical protein n=1 Tax=Brachybacterium sp. GPGPB12 TaxID=3023517 RepID=UPI00313425F3
MPQQRWYAHKGAGAPQVEVAGWAPLRIAPDHATVLLVAAVHLGDGDRPAAGGTVDSRPDGAADGTTGAPDAAPATGSTGSREPDALYQVPLVPRRPEDAPAPEEGAEIGVLAVAGGPLRVDDATRDADGRAALVATLVSGDGAAGPGLSLASHRTLPDSPAPLGRAMRDRVLAGEQSNTSLIIETEGASPLIVKLFRVSQDGENPDAAAQGALTAQGSAHVPAVVGAATVRTGAMRTHALVAQEFLPQVEDAWRVAPRLARAGEDFTAPARALGMTLAEVHRDLADALGTVAADEGAVRTVIAQMHGRLAQVAAEVEQVAAHREPLAALLDAAAGQTWPAMRRIHGDLHLGQVLASPERGWVLRWTSRASRRGRSPSAPCPTPRAGRRRDLARPRLRRRRRRPRARGRRERLGGRRPCRLPRGLGGGGGDARLRGARRLRGRQGGVRGAVRVPSAPRLVADPARRARADQRTRRGGGVGGLRAETGLVVVIGWREPGRNGALMARTATRTPTITSSRSPSDPPQVASRIPFASSAERRVRPWAAARRSTDSTSLALAA